MAKINELGRPVYFVSSQFEQFQTMVENTLVVVAEHSGKLNSLPNAHALGILGLQKTELENVYTFVPAYLRVTEAERNWRKSIQTMKTKNHMLDKLINGLNTLF